METSISVTVRWKAGFAGGYEPQTFRLEYKETTESGKILSISDMRIIMRLCWRGLFPVLQDGQSDRKLDMNLKRSDWNTRKKQNLEK